MQFAVMYPAQVAASLPLFFSRCFICTFNIYKH